MEAFEMWFSLVSLLGLPYVLIIDTRNNIIRIRAEESSKRNLNSLGN